MPEVDSSRISLFPCSVSLYMAFTMRWVSNGELRRRVNSGELQNIKSSRFCWPNVEIQDSAGKILKIPFLLGNLRFCRQNIEFSRFCRHIVGIILKLKSWILRLCQQNIKFNILPATSWNSTFCRQNHQYQDYESKILKIQYPASKILKLQDLPAKCGISRFCRENVENQYSTGGILNFKSWQLTLSLTHGNNSPGVTRPVGGPLYMLHSSSVEFFPRKTCHKG